MTTIDLHPAVPLLLRLQAGAALRRIARALRSPKNLFSVVIALVLATLWLVNAAASVWLRESADPRGLEMVIAFSLSAYVVWHIVRVGCFLPEHPLEQTDHQRELLSGLPLRPRDIVSHHLAGIGTAGLVKAVLVTLLLMPDLPLPVVGCLGIFVALLIVELLRTIIEITVWGLPRTIYLVYRIFVVTSLMVVGLPAIVLAQRVLAVGFTTEGANILSIASDFAIKAHGSLIGTTICKLWRPYLELVMADGLSNALWGWCFLSSAIMMGLACQVIWLYGLVTSRVTLRERRSFLAVAASSATNTDRVSAKAAITSSQARQAIASTSLRGAIGSLFWRQAKGAKRHTWGLLIAMAPPTVLALSPLTMPISAEATFLSVVSALAFYTFLLLPTALKFDFRRDLDRMGLLISLPVGPLGIAIGQIATPVVLATSFQIVVIAVCHAARPVAAIIPITAVSLLALMNVFVFAVENLVFLKYPHRLQQEGISVLLRTTLTFTAKGLLFGLALGCTQVWRMATTIIAEHFHAAGYAIEGSAVFVAGVVLGLGVANAMVLSLLAATVKRFDPAEHLPAS